MEDRKGRRGAIMIAAVLAILLLPALVFTAVPNMFFGFGHSETDAVIRMTEQAKIIGSI